MFMNVVPQGSSPGASPTRFNLWRRLGGAVQNVSAFRSSVVNFTGIGDPEQLPAAQVSVDFFKLFGAPVVAGRAFDADGIDRTAATSSSSVKVSGNGALAATRVSSAAP